MRSFLSTVMTRGSGAGRVPFEKKGATLRLGPRQAPPVMLARQFLFLCDSFNSLKPRQPGESGSSIAFYPKIRSSSQISGIKLVDTEWFVLKVSQSPYT